MSGSVYALAVVSAAGGRRGISALYSILGAQSEGGNNLLMDAIYGYADSEDDNAEDEEDREAEQEAVIDEDVVIAAQNAVEKASNDKSWHLRQRRGECRAAWRR